MVNGSNIALGRSALILVVACCILIGSASPGKAGGLSLSPDELDYIAGRTSLRAASIDGGAPLHYRNSRGEIKGIAVSVLDEIAAMTGLMIEYELYNSIAEAVNSGAEILFGVTGEYAPPGVVLSKPYLESEAVLYYSSSLDPKQLSDKRFAAIRGGTLPEGITEEHAIYFNNREDAIRAVDRGEADYGHANEYSLAFYTLQDGYKNIVTIPTGKEGRAYCMGLTGKDGTLLSIINKSIEAIDEHRMQTLILDVAAQVEKRITLSAITDAYGRTIAVLIMAVIAALSFSAVSNLRSRNRYRIRNKIYRVLSRISNEYLFEYNIRSGHLDISGKFDQLMDVQGKKKVGDLLLETRDTINNSCTGDNISTIKLPFQDGSIGTFKIICSVIRDDLDRPHAIVGKLIDISAEVMERERLVYQLQLDGLTGLYNAAAAKKMISSSMKRSDRKGMDAFILVDCDNFKNINDTWGHLKGDRVLKDIGESLRHAFRQTDIIARIGGDEFCVYMHDLPSAEPSRSKCRQLLRHIDQLNEHFRVTISIGIALLDGESTYSRLFEQADQALYIAKRKGGAQIAVHRGSEPQRSPDPAIAERLRRQ